MKVSAKQKAKTKIKIIRAAVDVITKKGFKSATMKSIAKKAGIADATIYTYFPTKESLLYGYYQWALERVIDELQTIEGFEEFSLQEQMQTFIESNIDLLLKDREFVLETFQMTFFSIPSSFRQIRSVSKTCMSIYRDLLNAAIEVEEIPEPMFQDGIEKLLFDYYLGIIFYWTKDESKQFSQTSILIDKTTELIVTLLRSDISNKMFDLGSYLFKTHVLRNMDSFKDTAQIFSKVKRNFMGDA